MRILATPAFSNRYRDPYTFLLYTHLLERGVEVDEAIPTLITQSRYDIWHLHWPHTCILDKDAERARVRTMLFLELVKFARDHGIKIIWTVHDLSDNEQFNPMLEKYFWKAFTNLVDGYINTSEVGRSLITEIHPKLNSISSFVIPLGHFRDIYPNHVSKIVSRNYFNIDEKKKVILFLGRIWEYKNVPHLIQSFKKIPHSDTILIIAGQPNVPALEQKILKLSEDDNRIRLDLQFIPEEQLQFYFGAADLVVLPYRQILNSGGLFLALTFNRPVLVPDKGSLSEVKEKVGEDWVRTYTGELDERILIESLNWASQKSDGDSPKLNMFNWDHIADRTKEAYEAVIRNSK